MERLILIVEQLEESKRLILIGGIPQLRMALLLLDTAVELLMHRQVTQEFASHQMWENLLHRWLKLQEDEKEPERIDKIHVEIDTIRPRIIPASKKRDIQNVSMRRLNFWFKKQD